eukprot:jgi/Mesvir1/26128/Mv06842-RA.1
MHRMLVGHTHADPDQKFGVLVAYMRHAVAGGPSFVHKYPTLESWVAAIEEAFRQPSGAAANCNSTVPAGTEVKVLGVAYDVRNFLTPLQRESFAVGAAQ